jgi:hypothetical protein
MFIAMTTPNARVSSVEAALMGILAPTDHRQWRSEYDLMPLLRSLADRATRVATDMALLTELFPSDSARLSSGRSAMFIAMTTPNARVSSVGAASTGILASDRRPSAVERSAGNM